MQVSVSRRLPPKTAVRSADWAVPGTCLVNASGGIHKHVERMIKTACRLAISISLITASVIWIAHGMRMVPDAETDRAVDRLRMTESIAIATTAFVQKNQTVGLGPLIEQLGTRNSSIESIGVFRGSRMVAEYGDHRSAWRGTPGRSTVDSMSVDITVNDRPWGAVQVQYAQPVLLGNVWSNLILILFCGSATGLLTWFFLTRSLKYLNPGKVVPSRVRNALDAMAEGLILLDHRRQIVLANLSFSEMVERPVDSLLGNDPAAIAWLTESGQPADPVTLPWQICQQEKAVQRGVMLQLTRADQSRHKYMVNATPIIEENGNCRGVLASFDDVTALEDKRIELSRMLSVLKSSRDEIRRQNEQLTHLAARDPLTGCLNRRAFLDYMERHWNNEELSELSVLMIDIDFFKSINDNYGHSTGDDVIRGVAAAIETFVPDGGQLCRYGGEEFCVAFPNVEFQQALELAESIRETVGTRQFHAVDVTLSIGVSSRQFHAMDSQHLLEQADQSLYAAKNAGRDTVVGWEEYSSGMLAAQQILADGDPHSILAPVEHPSVIAALYTALYYRDRNTALHSARVAALAMAIARRTLDPGMIRVIEIAALLHDIGKIGIPDSILHRPDRLEGYEMNLMQRRDSIAASISRSALVSPDVSTVISNYAEYYRNGEGLAELQRSQPRLALACQILHVADAFDSMVNDTEYRFAKSIKEAIIELQDCAPNQFVPELVEELMACVESDASCLVPVPVPGAVLGVEQSSDSLQVIAAAQTGDLGSLRIMMRRLKREALSESPELQQVIEQLESSLEKSDDELQRLFDTTQEIMELCRQNAHRSDSHQVLDWLDD